MDMSLSQIISALLAIVVIDLVLAGDNAIVIALASRNLPPTLRKKAILWGTTGAVLVRTVMTLLFVRLLGVPGLLFAGGALLLIIAWRLMVAQPEANKDVAAATGFWGAMKTIVVADAIMGLDNVLAVAGASHGSFALVVVGLLISVPIMVGGSQIMLRTAERFPSMIYFGGGVLLWTAVTMMTREPWLEDFYAAHAWLDSLLHALILPVIAAGYWRNAWIARDGVRRHIAAQEKIETQQAGRFLVVMDGTHHDVHALRRLIRELQQTPGASIDLLHASRPASQYVARFLHGHELEQQRREASEVLLEPARALIERAGLGGVDHAETGELGDCLLRVVQRRDIERVVIGTAPPRAWVRWIDDLALHKLLESLPISVNVIEGGVLAKPVRFDAAHRKTSVKPSM